MICLIGVAPTRPAEFVIFRIGQWTADATLVLARPAPQQRLHERTIRRGHQT